MKEPPRNILETLKEILAELKGIIGAAGTNTTALTALGVLVLSIVVLVFFNQSSDLVKIIAFFVMVLSNLWLILTLTRVRSSQQEDMPKVKEPVAQVSSRGFRVVRDADIFRDGVEYLLKEKSRGSVLIYAPTGVWHYDPDKARWFKKIGGCLARQLNTSPERLPLNADSDVTTELREFVGAYGLPFRVPRGNDPPVNYSPKKLAEFSEILDVVESLFLPFNGLSNAKLYRLLVDAGTVSGTGAIIFDNAVFIGFAAANRLNKVDYGIFFPDWKDVTEPITVWFRTHVSKVIDFIDHPIQDMDDPYCKDMFTGMDDIRVAIGLPPKHKSPPASR